MLPQGYVWYKESLEMKDEDDIITKTVEMIGANNVAGHSFIH